MSEPCRLRLTLGDAARPRQLIDLEPGQSGCRLLGAGERLHYLLIDAELDSPLPTDEWIPYSPALQPLAGRRGNAWHDWREWAPDLCYDGMSSPGFVLPSRVGAVLHGSCRKPHHAGGDGLARADRLLTELVARLRAADGASGRATAARTAWPSMLVMTGDQVYADDVAGPLLRAIHTVIPALRLPNERLEGLHAETPDARALYRHSAGYYGRQALLPSHRRNYALVETFFGGVEKPIFTTANAHNHLITLSEVLVMYLMSWSPALWSRASTRPPESLSTRDRITYAREETAIETFVNGLAAVRRLMAHIPVAMIFDDHDITDDWNLSREWEEIAYGHPFSRRVIGNALIAYLLNQAWGNRPEAFDDALMARVERVLREPGCDAHGPLIDDLLRFDQWHYRWPTEPPLIVIDSRTHRWRSESAARRPSGLMDWEALTDLQQSLRGEHAVLLVSPAPIFGVKLIEVIQRVFTWFGYPLMVDAENWMAHPGAAHAILNIFGHRETPRNFVILSGDVHYSFVYDVALRRWNEGPDIWQVCSSGLRNTFPDRLLEILDHVNRWLYAPRSPLNWLTRRRRMRVTPRKPVGTPHGRRLLNANGIGLVEIDDRGVPWRISQLLPDGGQIEFKRRDAESRWQ